MSAYQSLLLAVHTGKRVFKPLGVNSAGLPDFQPVANALLELASLGLLGKTVPHRESMTPNGYIDQVTVFDEELSSPGMVALETYSADIESKLDPSKRGVLWDSVNGNFSRERVTSAVIWTPGSPRAVGDLCVSALQGKDFSIVVMRRDPGETSARCQISVTASEWPSDSEGRFAIDPGFPGSKKLRDALDQVREQRPSSDIARARIAMPA